MNLLIIGSGGREHALGWKLSQSPGCSRLFFAPGNGGTAVLENCENVDIPVTDIKNLLEFAKANAHFTIVGPEMPLGLGIVDLFRAHGLKVFGPDQRAARLETSKSYAKAFMQQYGVPTAAYASFDRPEEALAALSHHPYPLWLKADGLASGKGAVFCRDEQEARQTIESMMRKKVFGGAGERVVLEEHLEGRELTLMCFTDGETILPLETSRDYQRVNDGNEGPNTGGMGCLSPVPGFEPGSADFIMQQTLAGIKAEGFDYRGMLYIELMLTAQGPKVIEYNARFGDPETQALMLRLDADLLKVMEAVEKKRLCDIQLRWKPETAVSVVLASGGYPGTYATGYPIESIPPGGKNAAVFHAGTKHKDGRLLTDGGRVLAVTALGADRDIARDNAYKLAGQIRFKDCHYRTDIGL